MAKPEEKKAKRKRLWLVVLCVVLGLVLLLAGLVGFFGFYGGGLYPPLENSYVNDFAQRPPAAEQDAAVVTADFNTERINILILGLDGATENEQDRDTMHQADTIALCSVNKQSGQMDFLFIPRGAVLAAPWYDLYGDLAFYLEQPLCNIHALGRDEQDAALQTAAAVQTVLGGVPLHGIVTVEWGIIGELVDALGGVTTPCFFDIAHYYGVAVGELITLDGPGAMEYVRERSLPGMDGSNQTRMIRQMDFMFQLLDTAKARINSNPFTAFSLFSAAQGHYRTDLSLREITYLGTQYLLGGYTMNFKTAAGIEDEENGHVTLLFPELEEYIHTTLCD